ncbi:hypothetical protein O9993_05915 [Vibrio lentus]|nr:hypothetical protein [Vibrio lentus]
MAHGLAIILISPLSAILVDKLKKQNGLYFYWRITFVPCLPTSIFPRHVGVATYCDLLLVSHTASVFLLKIPLVIDLLSGAGIEKGKIIGIFRLTERIGNIAGPMLAGVCLSIFGYDKPFSYLWRITTHKVPLA